MDWSLLQVGDEFTLTISLGMRDAGILNWNENTFFGLTDGNANFSTIKVGDTVASSGLAANNSATETQTGNGTFIDVSLTHIVTASDLPRHDKTGILIYIQGSGGSGSENQSSFDNVRLGRLRSLSDTDHDELPDAGETYYFGSLTQASDSDFDGDGRTKRAEFIAGTHPNNANSHFKITSITEPAEDSFTLTWDTLLDRNYTVSFSETLTGDWTPLSGLLPGSGNEMLVTDPTDPTARFYRIEVTLP